MTALRVLTVNHADVGAGGAAVAGYRLHRSLVDAGHDARLLVGHRSSRDETVEQLRAWRTVRRPLRAVLHRAGLNELDGIGAYGLHRRPAFLAAEVVHYHAVHGDWFSYPALRRLTGLRPSVLTLHDMWPLTGHCSFSFGCERWATGCGSCPHLDAFPAVPRDATALEWRVKQAVWAGSRLHVVSPSRWLADVARRSMLGRFPVTVIPHGIDTDTFRPVGREAARVALGLPREGPVMLFGAAFAGDRRKGPDLFIEALRLLPGDLAARSTVALMGRWGRTLEDQVRAAGCATVDFDYVDSDRLKASLYSAADVFVFPSRADNSPLTVLESLACGTPVVAFDTGGVGELVHDGVNGRLVPPEDPAALARAVAAVVEDPALRDRLGARARADTVTGYSVAEAVRRHVELYRDVIDGWPRARP